jgi:anaerobic magnesium-protoporphyrin IX monomethyl ester cyclase
MRVLLVQPPTFAADPLTAYATGSCVCGPQLGLLYLAAAVADDHDVRIVDLNYLQRDLDTHVQMIRAIVREVEAFDAQVVGITTMANSYPFVLLLCDEIKRQCPDTFTVLGGHQATFTAEPTLRRFPSVDAVLRGEAESTFPTLLRKLAAPMSLEDVPGLVYRDEGEPRTVDSPPPVVDLDDLTRPAYHLVPPLSEYQYRPLLVRANILTTRGCPMRCVFCSVTNFWKAGYRRRRPDKVVDEARWLLEALGARGLDLADDTFTLHPGHVRQVCAGLRELHVEWFARSRVDLADHSLIAEMADGGCTKIFFGAESGSPPILEYIGKRITPEQAVSSVRTARDNGIDSTVSFVFGFPPETRADILCSFELAERCLSAGASWVFFHRLTALPGTPLETELSTNLSLAGSYSAGPEVLSHPEYLQSIKPMVEANPGIFPSFFSTRLEHFNDERELLQFYVDEATKRGLEPVGFFL